MWLPHYPDLWDWILRLWGQGCCFVVSGRRAERVTSLDEPAVGRVTSPRRGRWPPSTLQRSPPPPAAPTACLCLPSYISWINCIIWPGRPTNRPRATFRLKHWNFIFCLLSQKASFIFLWKYVGAKAWIFIVKTLFRFRYIRISMQTMSLWCTVQRSWIEIVNQYEQNENIGLYTLLKS